MVKANKKCRNPIENGTAQINFFYEIPTFLNTREKKKKSNKWILYCTLRFNWKIDNEFIAYFHQFFINYGLTNPVFILQICCLVWFVLNLIGFDLSKDQIDEKADFLTKSTINNSELVV